MFEEPTRDVNWMFTSFFLFASAIDILLTLLLDADQRRGLVSTMCFLATVHEFVHHGWLTLEILKFSYLTWRLRTVAAPLDKHPGSTSTPTVAVCRSYKQLLFFRRRFARIFSRFRIDEEDTSTSTNSGSKRLCPVYCSENTNKWEDRCQVDQDSCIAIISLLHMPESPRCYRR